MEQAGFEHVALVELDDAACETLRCNRPWWNVIHEDVRQFDARPYAGIDLVAGGVPCPPFSIAGKQLGKADERDLFPTALRIVDEVRPRAMLIENVRGVLERSFAPYRAEICGALADIGYVPDWRLVNACHYGVSQLRPRAVLIAIRKDIGAEFVWPQPSHNMPPNVGDVLYDLMVSRGWSGAAEWRKQACAIAPTIVGGSHKHGGPDLGPTRARRQWAELGVDGLGLADEPPPPDFQGLPRLTVQMVGRLQGFPDDWVIAGRKTRAYRQIGNAFPPPVARAIGLAIRRCVTAASVAEVSA